MANGKATRKSVERQACNFGGFDNAHNLELFEYRELL
jgi:hypothetical protein